MATILKQMEDASQKLSANVPPEVSSRRARTGPFKILRVHLIILFFAQLKDPLAKHSSSQCADGESKTKVDNKENDEGGRTFEKAENISVRFRLRRDLARKFIMADDFNVSLFCLFRYKDLQMPMVMNSSRKKSQRPINPTMIMISRRIRKKTAATNLNLHAPVRFTTPRRSALTSKMAVLNHPVTKAPRASSIYLPMKTLL